MRKTTIKLLHIDVVVESAESPDFGKLAEGQPCYRVVVDQRSEVGDEYNPMMGPVPVASKDFTRTVVYRLFGGLVPVLSAPSSDSKQQALEEDWFILRKLAGLCLFSLFPVDLPRCCVVVFTITLHNRNMRVHFDKVASDLWSIRLQIDHFPEYDSALFFMQIEPGRPFVFKMLHTGPCSFAVPHDQYSVGLFRENANRAFIRVSRPIHHDYRPNKDFMVWDRRTQALSEWEFYPRLHVPVQEVKAQPSGWNPWMGMRSLDKEITSVCVLFVVRVPCAFLPHCWFMQPSFPCDERWKAVVSDCLPAFSSSLVNVVLGFARHRGRELIVVQPRPPRKEPLEGYLETEVEMDKRGGFMLFDLANDVLLGPIKSFWTGDLSYSLSPDIQRTAVASADGAWLACASFWPPRHGTPPHLGKFTMDEHVGLEALHHEYWTLTSSAFPHDELCLVRAPLPLINRLTKAQHDLSVVALYRCQPQAGGYRKFSWRCLTDFVCCIQVIGKLTPKTSFACGSARASSFISRRFVSTAKHTSVKLCALWICARAWSASERLRGKSPFSSQRLATTTSRSRRWPVISLPTSARASTSLMYVIV